MATKYFCDRCNKEAPNFSSLNKVSINPLKTFKTTDLCSSCRDQLVEWLSTPPAVDDPLIASIPRASRK